MLCYSQGVCCAVGVYTLTPLRCSLCFCSLFFSIARSLSVVFVVCIFSVVAFHEAFVFWVFKCFAVRFGCEFTFVWPPLRRVLRCVYVTLSHLLNKTIQLAGLVCSFNFQLSFSSVSAAIQAEGKRERERGKIKAFKLLCSACFCTLSTENF